ncbi:hypothetical protein DL95DRAFT_398679, partial [Leptodontidium sp. 2 PMI_412]
MAQPFLETRFDFPMLKHWEEEESARIKNLSSVELVAEIALIMSGRSYSWNRISKRLRNVGLI